MNVSNQSAWAAILDRNPLPPGCPLETGAWLKWCATVPFETRDQLYRARVVLIAQWWADAMEDEIALGATVDACAASTFEALNRRLGVFALSYFQRSLAVAALATCWTHGRDLHVWELDLQRRADAGEGAALLMTDDLPVF
jgi:hypothetical protein